MQPSPVRAQAILHDGAGARHLGRLAAAHLCLPAEPRLRRLADFADPECLSRSRRSWGCFSRISSPTAISRRSDSWPSVTSSAAWPCLALTWVTSFWPFFLLMLVHCLLYVPTLSIANSIAFAHLRDPQREFGLVRMGGTVGWILAAWPFTFILVDWDQVHALNPQGFVGVARRGARLARAALGDPLYLSGRRPCLAASWRSLASRCRTLRRKARAGRMKSSPGWRRCGCCGIPSSSCSGSSPSSTPSCTTASSTGRACFSSKRRHSAQLGHAGDEHRADHGDPDHVHPRRDAEEARLAADHVRRASLAMRSGLRSLPFCRSTPA